ncbi:MAG: uracil-DNA glycosylase family protein [Candidatus Limivicinus sp.]
MDSWEKLKAECAGCRACALCETRHNLVFGVGREDAEVMFIGEGPGEQEDLQGEPFVGPAGKLLDTMLEIIDLDRNKVYIANMVKCRPPRNRDPQDREQDACSGWLRRQIALVDPKIIVCLGRIAAMGIIDPEFRITREHGQWSERDGRMYMATYHPSALLRDPAKRPEAFEDLRELRSKIRQICRNTY